MVRALIRGGALAVVRALIAGAPLIAVRIGRLAGVLHRLAVAQNLTVGVGALVVRSAPLDRRGGLAIGLSLLLSLVLRLLAERAAVRHRRRLGYLVGTACGVDGTGARRSRESGRIGGGSDPIDRAAVVCIGHVGLCGVGAAVINRRDGGRVFVASGKAGKEHGHAQSCCRCAIAPNGFHG